ncbi:MAG: hypothetical protein ACOYWZ_02540 [Bacillota bacterium]
MMGVGEKKYEAENNKYRGVISALRAIKQQKDLFRENKTLLLNK